MSTNWYMNGGVGLERVHLGQSTPGWKFLFRADHDRGVTDIKSWLGQLESCNYIINEYGNVLDEEDFLQTVEFHENGLDRMAATLKYRSQYQHYWLDNQGNVFCDLEFS